MTIVEDNTPRRPTWAEIDLDALSENLGVIRRQVGPEVKIIAAVKADAYGHGAAVANRGGVVSTTENEDPDRDAGEQEDAHDQTPPPLYGAEDVLSAQGSSAFQLRGLGPTPRVLPATRSLVAANWLPFRFEDTTERDPPPRGSADLLTLS